MAGERWIFSQPQIANTPSRKCGIDAEKELNYRQQTANMVQDMGQKLQVYPLVWNIRPEFEPLSPKICQMITRGPHDRK